MAVQALWFSLAALALISGQAVNGQCDFLDIGTFVLSNLGSECQSSFTTLSSLQTRAIAAAAAGDDLELTDNEETALNGACVDSCVGAVVDYLQDNNCPQDDINGLATLCYRNPFSTNLCIATVDYVLGRVDDAIAACNTTGTECPANCSALLPELYGNGGCCMKTRLPIIPSFDAIVNMSCDYFDLCAGVVGATECSVPYVARTGQECTDAGIDAFAFSEASGLSEDCQRNYATVQAFRNRATALTAAGQPVAPTAAENTALNMVCAESCMGTIVEYVEDTCTAQRAEELASLCTRNPGSGNTCIQTIDYVLSRVPEAVAACNTTGTECPANCSALLPELYGNGGCCMKTTVPIVTSFDTVVDMFCRYFELCADETDFDAEECSIPFVEGSGTTVFVAKTLLVLAVSIATFLKVV